MVQKLSVVTKQARDAAFTEALAQSKTPEEAATKLGVSLSTVMRFKRGQKQKGNKRG